VPQRSSDYPNDDGDVFGYDSSQNELERAGNANSAEEVIGEIGLVLVIILGMIVALNLIVTSLHMV